MIIYANPTNEGLDNVSSYGDGTSFNIRWFQAYSDNINYRIAYHIYYSTVKENVFSDGVKFVSIDDYLDVNIIDLVPGQLYFFSVRPVEYDPNIFDLSQLPIAYDNLRFYNSSLLRQDISDSELLIPLIDAEGFPSYGVVRIGAELVSYSSVDLTNDNLIVSDRGAFHTIPAFHNVDGYDGYHTYNPAVSVWTYQEFLQFDRIFMSQSRFEYPNHPMTIVDGYHQVTKDLLSTDLSVSDALNQDFPPYDYAGYHRIDPTLLLSGACVGSYIGGEAGCIDGYGNVNVVRGLNLQDKINQREEMLLNTTGRPAVLLKRQQTGITCACYLASSEYPDDRCYLCGGSKFVWGWYQFFNPRRSDGRILVRAGPTDETLKMYEPGQESEFPLDLWTLTVPTIKTKDVIILFDQEDNEEFRYEVISVTRNNTILGFEGMQKLKVQRIRKFDPAYQIRAFRNTSEFPTKINTTISFTLGIPHHSHEIVRNEKDPSTWSQMTSIMQGHNHPVLFKDGQLIVWEVLGHTHQIII